MIRRQPRSTRTDTLFPYTTLFRSSAPMLLLLLAAGYFFLVPSGTYAIFAINWTVPSRATGLFAAVYTLVNSLIAVGCGPMVVAMVSDRLGGGANLSAGMVVLGVGAGTISVLLLLEIGRAHV